MINTNNYGKETGQNLKPYIWNKNVNLVIRGRGREDEGCSFSGFSFSACIIIYFAFENQNEGVISNRIFVSNLKILY